MVLPMATETPTYHIPALLPETMQALDIKSDGIYADATFGGGGHSRAILSHLGPEGRLFGFDQDIDALTNAPEDFRFTFVHSNFRYMPNFLHLHGVEQVDGILADLGVSFHHFDDASRGFSFRADAPLDMRMNRNGEKTAADILATATEEEMTAMLRSFTDLKKPKDVARAIAKARETSPVDTTFRLAAAVEPALNPRNVKKDLAQIFQALRIEVNSEMEALRRFLDNSLALLRPGGRLAVLTYHSIEDRMVKNFMKSGNIEGKVEKDFYGRPLTPWRSVGRSHVSPTAEETELNPRSRSAKLRAVEKLP